MLQQKQKLRFRPVDNNIGSQSYPIVEGIDLHVHFSSDTLQACEDRSFHIQDPSYPVYYKTGTTYYSNSEVTRYILP